MDMLHDAPVGYLMDVHVTSDDMSVIVKSGLEAARKCVRNSGLHE
jgi:hypothetical protein